MKPELSTFGVALLCDQRGVILKLLHNGLGLDESAIIGKPFPQIVDLSNLQKALSFLVQLRAKGSVFDWETNIQINDELVLVHCAGLVFEEQILIMAGLTRNDVNHLYDGMMRLQNEGMNLLRDITKGQVELARRHPVHETRHFDDLTTLNSEMVNLQRELTRKNVELERLNGEIQRLAITDALTQIYNRRGFFELGRREVPRSKRSGTPLTAIMFDLDHFKRFNDKYGHSTGDRVLEEVAMRCGKQLRAVDIFGRYGGEEFCVLLPDTALDGALVVAERLRYCTFNEPIRTAKGPMTVSISIGLAVLNPAEMELDELLDAADQALFKAKELGRNQVYSEAETVGIFE